jgi:TRAP-type mannitol/chloroaromatic compound transport system permease large subunit
MHRILRAFAYTLLTTVAYNVLLIAAARAPAAQFLALFGHGAGFTLGIAAGCIATNEVGLLFACEALVLLLGWPVDLLPLSFALVGGGLLGAATRSFVQGHRNEPVSARRHE